MEGREVDTIFQVTRGDKIDGDVAANELSGERAG